MVSLHATTLIYIGQVGCDQTEVKCCAWCFTYRSSSFFIDSQQCAAILCLATLEKHHAEVKA